MEEKSYIKKYEKIHGNHNKVIPRDEGRDNRRRSMHRSHSSLSKYTPYMNVAQFVGTLKSKSALMIFDRHSNLKYKYSSRNFAVEVIM